MIVKFNACNGFVHVHNISVFWLNIYGIIIKNEVIPMY